MQPGTGTVWAAVHGRDQLGDNWGFSAEANANNPAEELVQVAEGDDIGWPYCYYSNDVHKKVLAPEYGGDGRTVGRCAQGQGAGDRVPRALGADGAGVLSGRRVRRRVQGRPVPRFHGSWNRAPLPQEGYRVVFAPFADGKPTGKYETFATHASGEVPGGAASPWGRTARCSSRRTTTGRSGGS